MNTPWRNGIINLYIFEIVLYRPIEWKETTAFKLKWFYLSIFLSLGLWVMMFNTTFHNISVIS